MSAALQAHPQPASRLAAARWPLALLVVGALLLLGWLYFAARRPAPGLDSDATLYLASAQSLAAGHGYRLPGYLADPPNTFYPPAYSLALAALFPLQLPFPESLPLLQLANLLAFYALLGLSAVVLRRCYGASPGDTALAIALAATSPLALALSTLVLSDSFYGVLALGSLLAVRAGLARPGPRGLAWLAAGALLAAAVYYTRTIGVALLGALAIEGLRRAWRREWARAALLLLPSLLAVPWLAWSSLNGGSGYLRHWVHGSPGWAVGVDSPEAFLVLVLGNLLTGADALWAVAPALVSPDVLPGVGAAQPLAWLVSSVLFVWTVWQSWRRWRRDRELIHLYLALYLLLLLLWPYRVLGRLVWPVAPLVAWYLVVGLRAGWDRIGGRAGIARVPVAPALVGVLLLANALWLGRTALRVAAEGWPATPVEAAEYAALQQATAYVRASTPPDAALATNHLATMNWWYLYTGRRGVDAIARADGAEPFYVDHRAQGDPEAASYFVYYRGNGSPRGGADDLPVLQAALAARGAPTEPLYCTDTGAICIYDWRRR